MSRRRGTLRTFAALAATCLAPGCSPFDAAPDGEVDGSADVRDAAAPDVLDGSVDAGACANRALELDGTDDVADVPHDAVFDEFGPMTIEAWVYPTDTSREVQIVSHNDYGAIQGFVLLIINRRIQFRFHGGGQGTAVNAGIVPENQWSHVAGVFDGSRIRAYLNGAGNGSTISLSKVDAYSGPLRIGGAAYSNNGFRFKGRIDEVRLSRVPRYTESTFAVPTAAFVVDQDTVALWHLDEPPGESDVRDETGAHDGSLGLTGGGTGTYPKRIDAPCVSEMRGAQGP